MLSNTAAWLTAQKARPLQVKSSPYTLQETKRYWSRMAQSASIPWIGRGKQWATPSSRGRLILVLWAQTLQARWSKYLGKGVARFKIDDRVIGLALELISNKAIDGAFQAYIVLLVHLTSPIPATMSFVDASVLPLGISTAACGLIQKEYLALQFPSASPKKATGETILIWGGSSSIGSNSIQLAVTAGYELFTMASPKNFEYVKKLGVSEAFDPKSKTVIADLTDAFKSKTGDGLRALA